MKAISRLLAAASLMAACTVATSASAAKLSYSFKPVSSATASYSFIADSDAKPTSSYTGGFYTTISDYMRNGVANAGVTSAYFFTKKIGGGFDINGFTPYGAQLFSGTTAAPTLLTGDFALFSDNATKKLLGTLSVTSAVPEPASWAMMMMGIGAVGFAMRRRQKVTTRVQFA